MNLLAVTESIYRDQLSAAICIGIMIIVSVIYIMLFAVRDTTKKFNSVLNPTHKIGQAPKIELQRDKKRYKQKKTPFRIKLNEFFSKKGWDKKVHSLYVQAGHEDKQIEDLIIAIIKCTLLGVFMACALYFALGNILIMLVGLIIPFFPVINLFSEISDRKKAFNAEFPYFLQTLSFVLKNGANMSIAFEEVVNKQNEGVLKQVMLDVIKTQKIEGGNFEKAFATIPTQINTEETREFIDIVHNQIEKGASVSEVFQQQSDLMTERFNLRQTKLIASASTRIFIPILMIMCSIIIFFLNF